MVMMPASCAFGPYKASGTEPAIAVYCFFRVDGEVSISGEGRSVYVRANTIHAHTRTHRPFVTTVFPASSETIENVLSDRKCVCYV